MALAVIAVTKNGIPVSQAAAPFGLPVTVSTNGYGLAVIPVASGGRPVFDTTGTLFGPAVIPANTVLPVITGATQVGSTLFTSSGTWSGTAATYTYQWQRNAAASAEATAFLARTSGLDATHTNAYTDLINGLVADGIWAKLDMLHIYATQNTATAQLNLISSSYPATLNGSPAFTADRGYTGVEASTTVYISTGFNPATAPSPKYVKDSAHISAWSVTNIVSGNPIMGARDNTGAVIYTRIAGNLAYFLVNNVYGLNISNANGSGHFIASRGSSTVVLGYRNGTVLYTGSENSASPLNAVMLTLGATHIANPIDASSDQCAMASIGSNLTSTDATNFYNRLRTYMTAVGVP